MIASRLDGPRFRVDDLVYFAPGNAAPRGGRQALERYTVVAVMPPDTSGAYQYRIRPIGSGPHRVAAEHELRR